MRKGWLVAAFFLPALAGENSWVIEKGDLTRRVVLSGSLIAQKAARYQAPVTSTWRTTLKWLAEEGRPVQPGDPIASIDPANLATEAESLKNELIEQKQTKALRVTSGERERLEKQLQFRQAEVAFQKARLDAAVPEAMVGSKDFRERQLEMDRKKKALDQATLALETQKSNLKTELAQLDIGIQERQERLARAEEALGKSIIRATVPGIVVHEEHPWYGRKIRAGDTVNATQFLVQIPDLSSLEVNAFVGEAEAGLIQVGQPARLRLDAYPDLLFTGKVRQISPSGSEREQWGQSRYFWVAITLDTVHADVMRPGMSVQCEIPVQDLRGVLLAPIQAVLPSAGKFLVQLEGGKKLEVQPLGFDENRVALAPVAGLESGTTLEAVREAR